jgi:aryl-alcohol dehydrogenase-like predicted oxidoreductase
MKFTILGKTGARVSRIGFGGYPISARNAARGWDPYTEHGRGTAIATVRRALECGINYFDTAADYGEGHSEKLIGEALQGAPPDVFIATKVRMSYGREETLRSVEQSLGNLCRDRLDLIQVHGGYYTAEQTRHVLEGGLMEALSSLREQGVVRFLGATAEEPFSLLPLLRTGLLDVVQVRYNLIYQAAAHHLLDEARQMNLGVTVMRSLTSGVLQHLAGRLFGELPPGCDLDSACLRFVLSDSRVHVAHIGMRWPEEVDANVGLVDAYEPPYDVADLPRGTGTVYEAQDALGGTD